MDTSCDDTSALSAEDTKDSGQLVEKKSRFDSMPNFRQLLPNCDATDSDDETCRALKLYRSSRPDFLTPTEVDQFVELGIRCIIDFRSTTEYRKASGQKLLDAVFPVYKVKIPTRYKPGDQVRCVQLRCSKNTIPALSKEKNANKPKHYLINFFRLNYVWNVFFRAPWYICLYSLLYLIVDLILRTGYKYFVRVFARHVLNKMGLRGQYIDMLTYSQASICSALKLLTDPENVPAMLNCAHGKDRTGLVSALVLSCLGWSKENIAYDYGRSEMELSSVHDRIHDEIVVRFHMSQSFTTAKSELMMEILDYIDLNYGSASNYLESIGFSQADQQQLRVNLISTDALCQ